ncbi:MAG: hypothetical protein ACRYF0_18690 [Janthinobacterium lividum]
MTSLVAAQRPTTEVAKPTVSFWPINYPTGTIVFTAPTAHPLAPALAQATAVTLGIDVTTVYRAQREMKQAV